MAPSLANIASPDLKLPYEVTNLFSAGLAYAVLTAFAALFLILTVIWYRKVPAASSQTAEWFLTAGRNMKSGIVAASIVCTWTWAATLMVSSAKGYEHGIAGPYWYAAGATIPLLLFAVLAIYLKRRAPMAHTFGEFVWHRFGGPSHRLMLCLGLLTCAIVTAMVVLGGANALRALTGLDVRLTMLLIPLAFAFYSALGGLRGSIIVEYVQMVVLLGIALVLTIWFWSGQGDLGIFERLRALPAREGEAYLTMASLAALLFGIVNTIGNFGTVFMDQTYWQRAIAASDHNAGRSFLIGGLAWFAIPFGVATALGVGGLALGFAVPVPYTDIAPTTAAAVFGPLGAWLFLIMLFMAIISTGNAESVAVASLVATDIYKTYVRPQAGDGDILRIARGATLAFALLIGPVCLALHTLAIDMEWLYMTMGIFVGAGVIPLALGLLTDRLTGRGAYWATMGGLVVGLAVWATATYQLEGAITIDTLSRIRPITIGNLAVILTSALICGIDCARPHARFRFELLQDAIRSYLAPPLGAGVAGTPPHSPIRLSGQERRLIRWVVGLTILLELIVPGGLYLSGIQFGQELFAVWVILSLVWLLMAAGFMILLPIKDHFEIECPERLGLTLSPVEHGIRTELQDSIGNRLFLSFLTVVLTLGIGAVVSLVKLGTIEYLRETNVYIITEEALHEDMVASMIPQVFEERSRGEYDGLAAAALSERVKLLAASPHTPSLLRAMISSPEPQGPIPYLTFGEKERAFIAGSIGATYRETRVGNIGRIGQQRRQAIVLILISLVGTLILGLILTIRTSASITLPIRRLAEASGRFTAGEPPAPPVPVDTADESGVLTEEFNAMAARIREQVTALKAAEEEFRLIVSHVSDAIVYLDLTGIVRWANHQTVVISGRSMEEVVGRSFMTILAPEAAAQAEARLAAIRRGESVPPLVEFEVRRPDGSMAWVEANITSVLENGKAVGRLLVARDITERKQAEKALRESEAFKNQILESSPDCIKVLDLEGRLLFMNKGGQELLEICDLAPFLNHPWVEFWKDEDKQRANTAVAVARAGGASRFIGFCPTTMGKPKWWDVFIIPLLDASGAPDKLLSISRDITERKQAEEALRESEERFRSAFENTGVGMVLLDATGRFLRTNRAFCTLVGYSEDELLSKTFLEMTHPEDLEKNLPVVKRLMAGEIESFFVEKRYLHKQGHSVWVHASVASVRDASGKPRNFIAQSQDITERKRMEEERRELYERLHDSHQGLQTLSHRLLEVQEKERHHLARELHDEIGQALTAAKINIQQAMHALNGPMTEAHLAESVDILDGTLQQIRNLALDLRPSLLDDLGLAPTLRWLVERHAQASETAIRFSSDLPDTRAHLEIELACYRITQEALTNAIRHAHAVQIAIELKHSDRELELTVCDDGVGFDLAGVLARAREGKSFGLLGMQERVSLVGGCMDIQSRPGNGTRIHARFPLIKSGWPGATKM